MNDKHIVDNIFKTIFLKVFCSLIQISLKFVFEDLINIKSV